VVTLLIVLALIFGAFGLWAVGCALAATIALCLHVLAPELSFPANLVVGILILLVPLAAGFSVILVERLSEVRGQVKSLRALVVLLSLWLLLSGGDWLQHLNAMLAALQGSETGYASALLVSALGAVLFCSAATALAVTLGQLTCQWVVMLGARMGKVELAIPWSGVRLLGALLIAGASLQLFVDLFAHEFSPKSLLASARERGLGK
jgi:hypothetical protein